MKKQITNYIFNATSQQITLVDYLSVNLNGLLLITNVTDNIIIYNFADSTVGATVSGGNIITLLYNTTTMSDTDSIQIFYDDGKDFEPEMHGEIGDKKTETIDHNTIGVLYEILEELKEIKEMWMEVL